MSDELEPPALGKCFYSSVITQVSHCLILVPGFSHDCMLCGCSQLWDSELASELEPIGPSAIVPGLRSSTKIPVLSLDPQSNSDR